MQPYFRSHGMSTMQRMRNQREHNLDPLVLIEYWAVDPDYDGQVLRSVWRDYQSNTANDEDPLRVVTQVAVTVPTKDGLPKVCVRVMNLFGFEAEVLATVGAV